ncbi:anthranilate/aminodeoxychorismate synthase component II [Pseudoalteromonas citrea]|uniref:Anthranilate/aminodeoxychorismate synthase component II n=1 Tax=Pseudoalteromonas citrea TaxID=43655 RepID=A0A5S3XQY4_9GAMM|nr:aminodeoxychorismate/anthranilate synthase component II [Pseudoalteromonas citrea]TMP43994.1 anthranilate/aminodeoxychorismate synthase component II [Pseudoalteromonas citrea]TMP59432.1 anthranilate/aminodeoxychorismate synthase component II [Pseudoalteromonas citrea]
MLLMIDNYDSFTYNLVHYVAALGHTIQVVRNDELSLADIVALAPDGLIISPGPFGPEQAGVSCDAIGYFAGKIPILGVCLGHQSIGHVFGAKVQHAGEPIHGKCSHISHHGTGLFDGLVSPLRVVRYHSLSLALPLPSCLEVTAMTVSEGEEHAEIMAIKHKEFPIYGVQFHPESIASEGGMSMLKNWLLETGLACMSTPAKSEAA